MTLVVHNYLSHFIHSTLWYSSPFLEDYEQWQTPEECQNIMIKTTKMKTLVPEKSVYCHKMLFDFIKIIFNHEIKLFNICILGRMQPCHFPLFSQYFCHGTISKRVFWFTNWSGEGGVKQTSETSKTTTIIKISLFLLNCIWDLTNFHLNYLTCHYLYCHFLSVNFNYRWLINGNLTVFTSVEIT